MKVCSTCHVEKLKTEFYARPSRASGICSSCKACANKKRVEWGRENPEYTTASQARGYQTRKTKRSALPIEEQQRIRDAVAKDAREWRALNPGKNAAAVVKWSVANLAKKLAYAKEWHRAHPGASADAKAAWAKQNADKMKASHEKWVRQDPDHAAALSRRRSAKWAKAHPAKAAAQAAHRRASKTQATPAWTDFAYIDAAYTMADAMTCLTGIKYHVDHIVPLRSKLVSGLHNQFNLQLLPAVENCSKSNRYWPDMPERDIRENPHA